MTCTGSIDWKWASPNQESKTPWKKKPKPKAMKSKEKKKK